MLLNPLVGKQAGKSDMILGESYVCWPKSPFKRTATAYLENRAKDVTDQTVGLPRGIEGKK